MQNKLAVDIGNTNAKVSVFAGKKIKFLETRSKINVASLKKLMQEHSASYVIISTVQHLSSKMKRFINEERGCFLLSPNMHYPFRIDYKTPETLGLDRIASIAGAWSLFPKENSLVIDAGTCIKYDLITKKGVYIGGNISPGLHMRLEAMHLLTKKLPQVTPLDRYEQVGTDTTSALQVGACIGALHEMRGFVKDYKKTFGKLNILLTGGDAVFFVNKLKIKIFDAPNLVLQGLNEILDYNA